MSDKAICAQCRHSHVRDVSGSGSDGTWHYPCMVLERMCSHPALVPLAPTNRAVAAVHRLVTLFFGHHYARAKRRSVEGGQQGVRRCRDVNGDGNCPHWEMRDLEETD